MQLEMLANIISGRRPKPSFSVFERFLKDDNWVVDRMMKANASCQAKGCRYISLHNIYVGLHL